MRLWIDTDVGTNPDDAIALLLACAHPGVSLVGVSTVSGDERARAATARRLLDAVGARDVAVVAGADLAADAIPGADALLAIGPLTNVARVVEAGSAPSLVTVMGGVFEPVLHRGEWRELETNFAADPSAASTVVRRADAVVVPLDVTAGVVLGHAERSRLAASVPALREELERWPDPVCIHDPIALFASLGEPFIRFASRRVRVDRRGTLEETPDGDARRVAVAVDGERAIARVFDLLAGGSTPPD